MCCQVVHLDSNIVAAPCQSICVYLPAVQAFALILRPVVECASPGCSADQ